jgi:hypothetical protein
VENGLFYNNLATMIFLVHITGLGLGGIGEYNATTLTPSMSEEIGWSKAMA